jgi:GRB2-related adaptor protein 2
MLKRKKSHMSRSNKSRSWNFGNISRAYAEQLLINEELGTFLIRDSEHFPGNLTLSIKDDDKIQHYRIKYDLVGRGYTVDDESFFPDLRLLVEVRRFRL